MDDTGIYHGRGCRLNCLLLTLVVCNRKLSVYFKEWIPPVRADNVVDTQEYHSSYDHNYGPLDNITEHLFAA